MKRSTQIGLAAAGVVLVATVWSLSGDDDDETSSTTPWPNAAPAGS
jgi:hypothetical protein